MGRDAWDLSEADFKEGEEGVIDVGASDGYEEVSLECGLGRGGGKVRAGRAELGGGPTILSSVGPLG